MTEKKIVLKVSETNPKYVGRGIALIDPKIMEELDLSVGDVLEITNNQKKSHVLLWTSQPEDYGKGLIRIDGFSRNNISVGIGDYVTINRTTVKKAQQIVISPTQDITVNGIEEYLPELLEGRVVTKQDIIPINIMGNKTNFLIISTNPQNIPVLIDNNTEFISGSVPKDFENGLTGITYEDIGGIKNEVQKIREMIELPLRHPEIFEKVGIDAPKGILLYGPPGTGKTLLAKAVANETNANFFSISGPEIMSKFYGESEERLRDIFKKAEESAPSIIFIDEIDSIAPKREEVSGDVEKRIVSQLLTLMDGLKGRGKVIVIGATNRQNALDPALRRPGRFDREIEIGIPDENGRNEILQIHTRGMPLSDDIDLNEFAKVTHGFVGADLEVLAKEAAMRALRRILPEIGMDEFKQSKIPIEVLNKIKISNKDFEDALKDVSPSAMREVLVERPNVKWDDIGGLVDIKEEIIESTEWPLKYRDLFIEADVKAPKGILLYGPPGTGKTLLAKAVATMSKANFISIKGPELISKWVGESEKGIREIFRKARQASPCVIFFDEIDSIAPRRQSSEIGDSRVTERLVSQMLTEMDGLEDLKGVVVIGATNRPDIIDEALIRPGRFDRIIEIPLPDRQSRKEILKIYISKKPIDKDVDIEELINMTDGFSGADLAVLCNMAALASIKEYVSKNQIEIENKHKSDTKSNEENIQKHIRISMKHFEIALNKISKKKKSTLVNSII